MNDIRIIAIRSHLMIYLNKYCTNINFQSNVTYCVHYTYTSYDSFIHLITWSNYRCAWIPWKCITQTNAGRARWFSSNYLIRAPLNDHLSHRSDEPWESLGRSTCSAYSYFIHPVRQGGSYGRRSCRGSPRLNVRYYTAFPDDFAPLLSHHCR